MRRTIFTFIMLCFVTLTLQAQDVWTAAGSSTIFGSNWNETDTSNDLTDLRYAVVSRLRHPG